MRWLFCVACRVKGGRTLGTGVRIATGALRPRNDRVFTGSTGKCSAGGQGRPPLRRCVTKKCVGEGLSCPPLCQPVPGHCRGRQSGHFLEIASLLPPPAALRRFPLPRATARVAPTDGNKKCGMAGGAEPRPYAWPVGAGVPALMAWIGCRWAAMMRHRRR